VLVAYAFGTLTRVLDGLENSKVLLPNIWWMMACINVCNAVVLYSIHLFCASLFDPQVPVVSVPVLAVSAFAWYQGYKSLWVCSLAVSQTLLLNANGHVDSGLSARPRDW
jgi:hypothetical protein